MNSPMKSDMSTVNEPNDKSESGTKKTMKPKISTSSLFIVLRYSDWIDVLLMILGTTGAIGDGMSTNILLVFASRIMNSLGYGNSQQNHGNFMDEVEKVICGQQHVFFFFLIFIILSSSKFFLLHYFVFPSQHPHVFLVYCLFFLFE